MPIHCITFDLDDTLWPIKPVLINAENKVKEFIAAEAEHHLSAFEFEQLAKIRKQLLADNPDLKIQLTRLRTEVYKRALLSVDAPEHTAQELAQQAVQIFLHHRSLITYFEDSEQIVEQLAKNYCLGAITNGNVRFEKLSIARHFEFYLSAEDVGVAKPEAKIFQHALEETRASVSTDISANEICHVGDDLSYDVLGANRAGFKSCWLDATNNNQNISETIIQGEKKPDLTIRHLKELNEKIVLL